MDVTRRSVLGGLCATSAHLLFSRRVWASVPAGEGDQALAAPPGILNLTLTAFSPGTLRISISPANDAPRLTELGLLDRADAPVLAGPGRSQAQVIPWGKYSIKVTESPVHVWLFEGEKLCR